jgi:uncharacterized membrane protein
MATDFTPLLVGVPIVVSVLIVAVAAAVCYIRRHHKSSAADSADPGVGGADIEAALRDIRDISSVPTLSQDIEVGIIAVSCTCRS